MRSRATVCALSLLALGLLALPAGAQQLTIDYDDFAHLRNRIDQQDAELARLRDQLGVVSQVSLEDEEGPLCTPFGPNAQQVPLRKKSVKVGGRIYWDNLWYDDKLGNLDIDNRTRFDTARIKVEGWVYENVSYRIQMDFGGSNDEEAISGITLDSSDQAVFKDVYLRYHFLPNSGKIWVGHFKEPFSLEEQTSSRFISFMERSNYTRLMETGRDQGIMYQNHCDPCQQLYWAVGAFRSEDSDDPPDEREDGADWSIASRMVWLPYYDVTSDGRFLLHLGLNYKHVWYGDDTNRFTLGQELTATNLANFNLTGEDLEMDYVSLEVAAIMGPWHFSAEYGYTEADEANWNGDGLYVQAGYFLTGEHKGYSHSRMAFDRTKVFEPWFHVQTPCGKCCGKGAWELAYRYSYVDSIDTNATFAGGVDDMARIRSHTFGVNWYLNNYARIMFNYVHVDADRVNVAAGQEDVRQNWFGTRFQVDF